MTNEELIVALADVNFRYAKTMPQWPHWYIVKATSDPEIYKALFDAWKAGRTWETFKGRRRGYLYLGDGYKYWAMEENYEDATVINRSEAKSNAELGFA